MTNNAGPDALHRAAVDEVVERVLTRGELVVSVDSPPGAGKSDLVVEVADKGSASGCAGQIAIISQTNAQADDLVERLARRFASDGRRVGRLHGHEFVPRPTWVAPAIVAATQEDQLSDCAVVVAPARKWAYAHGKWQLGIIDEAYQMRSDDLLRVGERFSRLLAVGDPGQLDPFTQGDERLIRGLPMNPIETAAQTLQTSHPHEVVNLPVSWRLTPAASALVSPSFYVRPFASGTQPGDRRVELGRAQGHRSDSTWELAARDGWAYVELPEAHLPRRDTELVAVIGDLVEGLLARGAAAIDGPSSKVVSPASLAVGVAHRDQAAAILNAIDRKSVV